MTVDLTAQAHLHAVLAELDSHCDSAAWALPVVTIRAGSVTVQTTPDDLAAVVASFHMAAAEPEPVALSSGDEWVVIPYSTVRTYDGARWRVWAPRAVTHAEFALIKAARCRGGRR